MALLSRLLCRLRNWAAPGPGRRESTPEKAEPSHPEEISRDDLTAIRGIGIATQNRLYVAGIKSYAQLDRASAEEVREVLGNQGRAAKVEDWIAQATELAKEQQS